MGAGADEHRVKSFIAADVGGTHARVARVDVDASGHAQLSHFTKYAGAEHPSLAAVFERFLATHEMRGIRHGVVACAGYAIDGAIVHTNLPWPVAIEPIRAALGFDELALVNDFEAVAYATPHLAEGETTTLVAGDPAARGPTLVVGPGTGLGAAVRIPGARHATILRTEAGQAAFAPSSEVEIEVLKRLRGHTTHVSNEHLLSGPGLVTLYTTLCEIDGATPTLRAPAEISAAAIGGTDATARRALAVFCGLMGSVVGDLVLLYGAQGGVFLAGGVVPQIKQYLVASAFRARFLDKGPMRALLERVPVKLAEHEALGVLGAAHGYLDRRARN